MQPIFPKLFSMVSDADDLLSLEPEELAGPLLLSLEGNQHIIRDNVISFDAMSKEKVEKYPSKHHDDILLALMEAWQWLERKGLLPQNQLA